MVWRFPTGWERATSFDEWAKLNMNHTLLLKEEKKLHPDEEVHFHHIMDILNLERVPVILIDFQYGSTHEYDPDMSEGSTRHMGKMRKLDFFTFMVPQKIAHHLVEQLNKDSTSQEDVSYMVWNLNPEQASSYKLRDDEFSLFIDEYFQFSTKDTYHEFDRFIDGKRRHVLLNSILSFHTISYEKVNGFPKQYPYNMLATAKHGKTILNSTSLLHIMLNRPTCQSPQPAPEILFQVLVALQLVQEALMHKTHKKHKKRKKRNEE